MKDECPSKAGYDGFPGCLLILGDVIRAILNEVRAWPWIMMGPPMDGKW
jgi:hypothetical protein